jgi:hypothetical protein
VQLSLDGGSSYIYDTRTDASLTNGFRFDGASRFLIWDMAPAGASTGFVTYDDLSVVVVPEPAGATLAFIGALAAGSFRRIRNKARRHTQRSLQSASAHAHGNYPQALVFE